MKKNISCLLLLTFLCIVSCQTQDKTKENSQTDTTRQVTALTDTTAQDSTKPAKPEAKPPVPANVDEKLNDLARVISGLSVDSSSAYAYLTRLPSWKAFAKKMDSSFAKVDRERFARMRKWRDTELVSYNDSRNLFYPFSGPDFVHAYNFFNKSRTMYMFGLEKVGNMPTPAKRSDKDMSNYFSSVQNYLSDVMNKSFFITNRMNANWYQVNGMTPILAIFMVRTGNQLVKITPMWLDSTGHGSEKDPSIKDAKGRVIMQIPNNMVKIDFADAQTKELKSVYYYSGDLSDGAIVEGKSLSKYLNQTIPKGSNGFLKSASYLLQYPSFTKMNTILKDRCQAILQDDTGVPYKVFEKDNWDFTFYGVYVTPIFPNREQPALRKAFKDSTSTVKPLPFGIGYHWMNRKDNLILAVKKNPQ